MEQRFWKPSVTSQFNVCPIPFHLDTFRGCPHDCAYCFARDFTTFARRKSEHKEFSYLVANSPKRFASWCSRTLNKQIDYNKPEEVAFKQRIPLKIGATADPFPYIEQEEKITFQFLKILQSYDYPVQMSTKNPEVFLTYSPEFQGANLVLCVTITTGNDDFARVIQPGAIPPTRRFAAVSELTKQGFPVFIRIQPFIYPAIMGEMQQIVRQIKDSGAVGFQTEGLKYRLTMPEKERAIFQKIGDYMGVDMRDYFKANGVITGSDREYSPAIKAEVLRKFDDLARQNGLKFYNADNCLISGVGCGSECCGTSVLRDYKILGQNRRTKFYDEKDHFAEHLPRCIVNFVRGKRFAGKTIEEAINELNKGEKTCLS